MSAEERHSSTARQAVDQTIGAHRECMRIVSAVEACLDQLLDCAGPRLRELRNKLALLAGALQTHFKHEQEGYLYRELPLAFPQFAERLQRLESEHQRILEAAHDAAVRSNELREAETGESHKLRDLNSRVQLLVATIRRHEAEENEILLSAHWRDIGAAD